MGFAASAMDFKKMRPTEPGDAYTDSQHAPTVAHSDLEEILAIPKDGRKQLLRNSLVQHQESDKSRNPYLKKLAAATAYSSGGSFLSAYKELHAKSDMNYRTSSAAQLMRTAMAQRATASQAASAHQLQRLQVTRAAKEPNQSQVSTKKLSAFKDGPSQ